VVARVTLIVSILYSVLRIQTFALPRNNQDKSKFLQILRIVQYLLGILQPRYKSSQNPDLGYFPKNAVIAQKNNKFQATLLAVKQLRPADLQRVVFLAINSCIHSGINHVSHQSWGR
jgi:hypothetical protein